MTQENANKANRADKAMEQIGNVLESLAIIFRWCIRATLGHNCFAILPSEVITFELIVSENKGDEMK